MKDEIIMKDGKPHKIAEVVMLPTEKASKILRTPTGLQYSDIPMIKREHLSPQHLYILSSEEIKEDDWCIDDNNYIFKMTAEFIKNNTHHNWQEYYKKIIATTDILLTDYIKVEGGFGSYNKVPRLSDDFLKAFVKAQGKIDKVLVEYFEQIPDWEDDLLTPEYETVLKVVRDNTITIKPIQKEKIDIVDLAEIELKSYVNPSEEFKDGFIDGVTIGYYHKNKEAIHTWIDKGIDVFSGKKTSWSREEERLQTLYYKLKVSPDNTITIRTVEGEKKDYSIEYLKFIATRFAHECRLKDVVSNHETCTLFDKWIKENL